MAGSTPIYGFPYPQPSDLVANYPALGQELAEDIEATLPTIGGLIPINSQSFTTVSSVSVNNAFTSAYTNYRILLNITAGSSTNVNVNFRLRASGSDTATNYAFSRVGTDYNNTVSGDGGTGATQIPVTYFVGSFPSSLSFDLCTPQLNTRTSLIGSNCFDARASTVLGQHQSNAQFDGFSILASAGTITGTVQTYGYRI
jgi:hypothetical protein